MKLNLCMKLLITIIIFSASSPFFALDNPPPLDDASKKELRESLKAQGSNELVELMDRIDDIKAGRPTKELNFDGLILPGLTQSEVDDFKFSGGATGKRFYVGDDNPSKPDSAFSTCRYELKKTLLDSDAEINTKIYDYVGRRHSDGAYTVDLYVIAHNAYNVKINATFRCTVSLENKYYSILDIHQIF